MFIILITISIHITFLINITILISSLHHHHPSSTLPPSSASPDDHVQGRHPFQLLARTNRNFRPAETAEETDTDAVTNAAIDQSDVSISCYAPIRCQYTDAVTNAAIAERQPTICYYTVLRHCYYSANYSVNPPST